MKLSTVVVLSFHQGVALELEIKNQTLRISCALCQMHVFTFERTACDLFTFKNDLIQAYFKHSTVVIVSLRQ